MLFEARTQSSTDVVPAVTRQIRRLAPALTAIIIRDHGKEMIGHVEVTVATNAQAPLAGPSFSSKHLPGENSNALVHQYLPKDTGLSI